MRPWTGFPAAVAASTFELGFGKIANNFVMRFPAGHEVLARCLKALEGKNLAAMDISETGPLLLNKVLGPHGVKHYCQSQEVFGPVPWNASWQLLRPLWKRFTIEELKQRLRRPHLSMRFTKSTVAVHLWNETWRAAGRDKHSRHDSTCLYETFQRRFNPENRR